MINNLIAREIKSPSLFESDYYYNNISREKIRFFWLQVITSMTMIIEISKFD